MASSPIDNDIENNNNNAENAAAAAAATKWSTTKTERLIELLKQNLENDDPNLGFKFGTYSKIAKILAKEEGEKITAGAVKGKQTRVNSR